jgi:putative ferrous iron transport protein C
MNLVEIKQHMMQVKITSLANICAYFNADPVMLRQMLGHWIRKGCVRQCLQTPVCATTCGKCSPMVTELYEWVVA